MGGGGAAAALKLAYPDNDPAMMVEFTPGTVIAVGLGNEERCAVHPTRPHALGTVSFMVPYEAITLMKLLDIPPLELEEL